MQFKAIFFFTLVFVIQISNIHADGYMCSQCSDYLNQQSCTSNIYNNNLNCQWQSGLCSNPPPQHKTSVSVCASNFKTNGTCYGYDGTSKTNFCSLNDQYACESVDLTQACSKYQTNSQCIVNIYCKWDYGSTASTTAICRDKTCADSIFGCGGSNMLRDQTIACVKDNNSNCVPVKSTMVCASYTYYNGCLTNQQCIWQESNAQTGAGTCVTLACSDFSSQDQCYASQTSNSTAKACKWVVSPTAAQPPSVFDGNCTNGVASDLTLSKCEQQNNYWFTYNSNNNTCVECRPSVMESKILVLSALIIVCLNL